MTLRLRFLGFEIASLTLDIEHDPHDVAPGDSPTTEPESRHARALKQVKRSAAWWALG